MSLRQVTRQCAAIPRQSSSIGAQYATHVTLRRSPIEDRPNFHIITSQFNPNPSCVHMGSNYMGWRSYGVLGPASTEPKKEGIFRRILKTFGWTRTPKSVLAASGYLLYIKVADEVNYTSFFEMCNMRDTFASWFIVMELHAWILATRLMSEEDEGRRVRNSLVKAMWEDVDIRSKKLEGALVAARKHQVTELNQEFQASLFAYDQGILSSDRVLASALWRRFLQPSEPCSQADLLKQIVALEMLVAFVRSQYYSLHKMSREDIILRRKFKWIPFTKDLIQLNVTPGSGRN